MVGGGTVSQEAGVGSPLQEAGSGRSGEMLRALGWEKECPRGAKQGRQEQSPGRSIL